MLSCNNLACKRGENIIFSNLNLKAESGDLITLKGPNGSGKTSFLKILSGTIKPYAGSIFWEEANTSEDIDAYRANIQFIGHKNAINRELTAKENLFLWASLNNNSELLSPTMSYLNLEKIADMPCRMLSQGWQRRVSLARLMITDRNLWLLDEPFANLDVEAAETLRGLIYAKRNAGGIIILSSHKEIELENTKEINMEDYA